MQLTHVLNSKRLPSNMLGVALVVYACLLANTSVYAQMRSAGSAPASVIPQISAPIWSELSRDQQSALRPLQKTWSELSDGQRRKWIAVIKNFSKLSEQDQAKIQDRMEDWAALKPLDRERARENFATTKLAPPSNKSESWEEYQALPQDERDRLAAQATVKKPGAAKSRKAMALSNRLPVPTAPENYPLQPERGELRSFLSPSTLLPLQNSR
jgi:hypothetical protein